MKKITDHIGSAANNNITIHATGKPGAGGAHNYYEVKIPAGNQGYEFRGPYRTEYIAFHHHDGGMVMHGVTDEALLAILIDRLRGFDSGPFSCPENAAALSHIESALKQLQKRTRDRQNRGVEGKMEK